MAEICKIPVCLQAMFTVCYLLAQISCWQTLGLKKKRKKLYMTFTTSGIGQRSHSIITLGNSSSDHLNTLILYIAFWQLWNFFKKQSWLSVLQSWCITSKVCGSMPAFSLSICRETSEFRVCHNATLIFLLEMRDYLLIRGNTI